MAYLAQESNFNFQKFLSKAFDNDFEQVIGIRFWDEDLFYTCHIFQCTWVLYPLLGTFYSSADYSGWGSKAESRDNQNVFGKF